MQIVDISRPIHAHMTVWPGDPQVQLSPHLTVAADGAAVSRLSLGTHTGTHVDPPAHFMTGGKTVDQLALDTLVGPAWVAQVPATDRVITAGVLAALAMPAYTERLLLKHSETPAAKTTSIPFDSTFAALSSDAADWLIAQRVRLVGTDSLSIEPFDGDGTVHRKLLGANVVIAEGLALGEVMPGAYTLVCLPLKIAGGDGAPARAVLITD